MPRDWDSDFAKWATAPGATEKTRCENAERMVKTAISESAALNRRSIDVFAQGSYRNRTNVQKESDVDICVCLKDVFYYDFDFARGLTPADAGIVPAEYTYAQFKNEVGEALVAYFGRENVSRGNKAFDIEENTYHVEADVVPAFEYRRYVPRLADGTIDWHSGTKILPDNGGTIINWPHQNYENGVEKHGETSRRFKKLVRILKNLRNEMADSAEIEAAKPIPSYLNECLGWNVPNDTFGHDRLYDDVKEALRFLFHATKDEEPCKEWGEINELKYLLRGGQAWTREQVLSFVGAAWRYVGFRD